MTFPPINVIAEIKTNGVIYCRTVFGGGRFVINDDHCFPTLEDALRRKITLNACLNATYLGHKIGRDSIV